LPYVLNLAHILSQIRNIRSELSLRIMRSILQVVSLDILGLHLRLEALMSVLARGSVCMPKIIGHVCAGKEACGFVQSRLVLSCLRLRNLSTELLANLPLTCLELTSARSVLMSITVRSHLHILFVVVGDDVLLCACNDLWLLKTRRRDIRMYILTLTREEVLRIGLVLLQD
jgi:hypothetical protein